MLNNSAEPARLNANSENANSETVQNFQLNKDRALQKKLESASRNKNEAWDTGGGYRVLFTAGAYEVFKHAAISYYTGSVFSEKSTDTVDVRNKLDGNKLSIESIITIKNKENHKCVLSLYHTKSSILVNGKNMQRFIRVDWPAIEVAMKSARTSTGDPVDMNLMNHQLKAAILSVSNSGGNHVNNRHSDKAPGLGCHNPREPLAITDDGMNIGAQQGSSAEGLDATQKTCTRCQRQCKSRAVCCDTCEQWTHYHCEKLSQAEINNIETNSDSEFNCRSCSSQLDMIRLTSSLSLNAPPPCSDLQVLIPPRACKTHFLSDDTHINLNSPTNAITEPLRQATPAHANENVALCGNNQTVLASPTFLVEEINNTNILDQAEEINNTNILDKAVQRTASQWNSNASAQVVHLVTQGPKTTSQYSSAMSNPAVTTKRNPRKPQQAALPDNPHPGIQNTENEDKNEFLGRWEKQLKVKERDLNSREKLLKRQELEHLEASKQIESLRTLVLQLEKRVNDLTSENCILRSKLLAAGPHTEHAPPANGHIPNMTMHNPTHPHPESYQYHHDLDRLRLEMRDQHIDLLKTMVSFSQSSHAPAANNSQMYNPQPFIPPMAMYTGHQVAPPNLGLQFPPAPPMYSANPHHMQHGVRPPMGPYVQPMYASNPMQSGARPPMGPHIPQQQPLHDRANIALVRQMKAMESNMASLRSKVQSIGPLRDQIQSLEGQLSKHKQVNATGENKQVNTTGENETILEYTAEPLLAQVGIGLTGPQASPLSTILQDRDSPADITLNGTALLRPLPPDNTTGMGRAQIPGPQSKIQDSVRTLFVNIPPLHTQAPLVSPGKENPEPPISPVSA